MVLVLRVDTKDDLLVDTKDVFCSNGMTGMYA
jgi:hypothetical protein